MMQYTLEDTCLTWNTYPSYLFTSDIVGPANTAIMKFSNCHNTVFKQEYQSRFWNIYSVTGKDLSKSAGFIFECLGEVFQVTTKCLSSANKGNSKDMIEIALRTREWSSKGIDLIRYENYGEVITDLCTVMGVDVTIDIGER